MKSAGIPVYAITAEGTAVMVFNSLVRNHGLPRRIISDRDTRYTAQIWNAIWKMCGTKLAMSPEFSRSSY